MSKGAVDGIFAVGSALCDAAVNGFDTVGGVEGGKPKLSLRTGVGGKSGAKEDDASKFKLGI